MTPMLQQLFSGLSAEESQELTDAIDYITEHGHSRQPLPEQSISRVINGLSPAVRSRFATLSEVLETPRAAPFQPKMGIDEYAQVLEADPRILSEVKGALDDDAIAHSLQRRLGTDASAAYGMPDQPPSMRDVLSAAHKIHGGK